MKQFQLKTLTELTSEEQQHIVAGSSASGCTCNCSCSCCEECNEAGQERANKNITGNTNNLGV